MQTKFGFRTKCDKNCFQYKAEYDKIEKGFYIIALGGKQMKKILFAASEAVPFIKPGGLADVVGSLPKYFEKEKYDVRVMIPKY